MHLFHDYPSIRLSISLYYLSIKVLLKTLSSILKTKIIVFLISFPSRSHPCLFIWPTRRADDVNNLLPRTLTLDVFYDRGSWTPWNRPKRISISHLLPPTTVHCTFCKHSFDLESQQNILSLVLSWKICASEQSYDFSEKSEVRNISFRRRAAFRNGTDLISGAYVLPKTCCLLRARQPRLEWKADIFPQ